MRKHIDLVIQGKVQGVYYRASAADKAKELGLTGFVRNQPDGSVYLEAEGAEDKLDQLYQWCLHGPPRAHVTECSRQEGPIKNFKEFTIQR
jgi:acylphosphatase